MKATGARRTAVAGSRSRLQIPDDGLKAELSRTWRQSRPHVAYLAAVALTVLVPLKVLRVSHGDINVALAVAQYADKTTVITGLLVLVFWTGLALLFAATSFAMADSFAGIKRAHMTRTVPLGKASLRRVCLLAGPLSLELWLMGAVMPWALVATSALLVPPICWLMYRSHQKAPKERDAPNWMLAMSPVRLALVVLVTLVAVLLLIVDQILTPALDDQVWLPGHKMTFANGTTVAGYVLADDGDRIVLLVDENRSIRFIGRSTITSDVLCQQGGPLDNRSLWDLSAGKSPARAPSCRS